MRERVVVVGVVHNYQWDDIKHWWKSLKLTGFSGEIHVLAYVVDRLTVRKMEARGIHVHPQRLRDQLVVQRFRDLAKLANDLPAETWVVFPDVGDIVFQTNPAEFLRREPGDKSIVVASEGITFEGNRWVRENLKQSFPEHWQRMRGQTLYNAGSIAGRAGTLCELAEDVYLTSIEKCDARCQDQAALNILLQNDRYESRTMFTKANDGWCFCAASSLFASAEDRRNYREALPSVREGKCYTGAGELTCMFHHYTRDRATKGQVRRWVTEEFKRRHTRR